MAVEQTSPGMRRADALRASPPMFKSRWLDVLSRVHWSVPLIVFVPIIVVLLVVAVPQLSALAVVGLLIAGYLVWTLTEYWLHRLVFHFEPDHPLGRRLHWIIHGVHHDHPNDPMRLVMPPSVSVPLAGLFYLAFVAALGWAAGSVLAASFLGGYLFYDMTHFHVHHHTPKTAAGKKLRELHMRHHFQDHTRGFGVSAPWWDHIFRTAPRRRPSASGSKR